MRRAQKEENTLPRGFPLAAGPGLGYSRRHLELPCASDSWSVESEPQGLWDLWAGRRWPAVQGLSPRRLPPVIWAPGVTVPISAPSFLKDISVLGDLLPVAQF